MTAGGKEGDIHHSWKLKRNGNRVGDTRRIILVGYWH